MQDARQKSAVANAINGRREKLELCQPRGEILCGGYVGKAQTLRVFQVGKNLTHWHMWLWKMSTTDFNKVLFYT